MSGYETSPAPSPAWRDGAPKGGTKRRTDDARGCEGYELRDPLGRRIGRVETLFADRDGRPRHVRVSRGPFGLFGSFLLPVRRAELDETRRVVALR